VALKSSNYQSNTDSQANRNPNGPPLYDPNLHDPLLRERKIDDRNKGELPQKMIHLTVA